VHPWDILRDATLDLLTVIGTGAIVVLLVGIALMALHRDPGKVLSSGWGVAVLFLGTQLPLLYRAVRRRRRNREKHRPELPLFQSTSLRWITRGITAGAGLAIFSGIYTGIVSRVLGPDSVENQIDFLREILDDRAAVALLVLIIAGLAPVCEEMFFRGTIFAAARAAGLERAGIAISAVLFAAMHLVPLLFPFYVLFGVVMCWLYKRSGTLAAPIAAHMTMNALACLSLLVQDNGVV
jgi:membrane protease YdiL (CAAX protease family)